MATQVDEGSEKSIKTIPDVAELPVVGSLYTHTADRLKFYLRLSREYGDIARYHFAHYPAIQINESSLVHSLLIEHANDTDKGETQHNAFEPVIGKGLFISEGDLHRQQRKLMAPSFQPRHIVNYADTMVRYSDMAQRNWHEGQTINIDHEMTALTMSIVGKVLFDADIFTETDELGSAMTTVLAFVGYTFWNLFPIPLSWPLPRSTRARKALTVLDTHITHMIEDRRARANEEDNDLLSILLRARDEEGRGGMSNKQLRDEALTIFGAGYETTATALTWTWYLLAQHPEIYQRMCTEIDTVLGGRTPTHADLPNLPYTLQVFKEAMRLYPPAYIVVRVALRDFNLNGYQIHKFETLMPSIYAIHRRPDYFPDPEAFQPERFTPERERELPRYAYMPFGAGPRICIGNHFAMMEGHLLLAMLAQQVTFELVPGQHIYPDPSKALTLRPNKGIKMIVHRRMAP
jgi:cytochrome P450